MATHSHHSTPFSAQHEQVYSLSDTEMTSSPHRTPVKRKYREVDCDDVVADDGYFSGYPSPSLRNISVQACPLGNCVVELPVCAREREHPVWNRDAPLNCRRNPVEAGRCERSCDQVHVCDCRTFSKRFKHSYENTPQKQVPYIPRRSFTEVKRRESCVDASLHHGSSTCSKSRNRLDFNYSTEGSCYCFDHPRTERAARNLLCDLDSVDATMTAGKCGCSVNKKGINRRPCSSPLVNSSSQQCIGSSSSDVRTMQTDISPEICRCSDLRQGFLRLARSAFCNLRRKDASPESFTQFSNEVNRTNEFLKQTFEMLKQFTDICKHSHPTQQHRRPLPCFMTNS